MSQRLVPTILLPIVWLAIAGDPQGGKRIYLTGQSRSGEPIIALMGSSATQVPAGILPCAGCHAPDGRGRPEGGVVPSDITWQALTVPYGSRTASGRVRAPYDEALLARAITRGIDASGNELDNTMPRYRMTEADLADLTAYIKRLGTERDPGVGDNELAVGVLLPPSGLALGNAVRTALDAWSGLLAERGGIFGRKVTLRLVQPERTIEARTAAARDLLDDPSIFALLAPFAAGIENDLAVMAADRDVPVIGPFTHAPRVGFPPNRQVFYLYSGLADQTRALVNFAVRRSPKRPTAAVIHPGAEPNLKEAAQAAEELNRVLDWASLHVISTERTPAGGADLARHLRGLDVTLVFYLGFGSTDHDRAFLEEAARLQWFPELYLPGSLARGALFSPPAGFAERVFLAFPTVPENLRGEGRRAYNRLREHSPQLPERPGASWLTALGAASLLEQGLRMSGRQVSRARLLGELEKLYEWPTGFTPPVTFNPNRRVGARGAYIVTVDAARGTLLPVSGWVDAEPPPSPTERGGKP